MRVERDFEELFAFFNKHEVKCCSLEYLITAQKISKRTQDQADLELLTDALNRRRNG
jgi:hypothetical protein